MNDVFRMLHVILFSALVFCGFGAARLSAADRYVALSGSGADGMSWATAYTDLQTAIDASSNGDVIYVKGGTYSLTEQLLWAGKHNLSVQGGYEGTGTPGESDPAQWPTVLTRRDGSVCRILCMTNVVNGALSGVTLAGGFASNTVGSAHSKGGGLYVVNSYMATLSSCTVSNNVVAQYPSINSLYAYGGGVCIEASSVTIEDSLFAENTADVKGSKVKCASYGGGIATLGASAVNLNNSVVRGNRAMRATNGSWPCGGGVYSEAGTFQIENCLVYGNNASDLNNPLSNPKYAGCGDGLYGNSFTVLNSTIAFNMGEGLHQDAGSQSTFTDCIVWGNGDDIAGASANVTLDHCNVGRFDGDTGTALIYDDPQFDRGFYLAAGSPCVDAGSTTAAAAGLDALTTRADGAADAGTVDLGYHAAVGTPAPVVNLHVAADGSDDAGDGSESNPFRSVTKALALLPDWGTVHIGPGTYTASSGETFPFVLDNRIGLSFIGDGATLDNEGVEGRRILEISNSLDVAFSGLVFTGACATEEASKPIYGGAVRIVHGGGIRFSDCTIRDNLAWSKKISSYGVHAYGGGIASCGASLLLDRCTVEGNDVSNRTASGFTNGGRGGGVAILGGRALLVNCAIVGNRTSTSGRSGKGMGGGLYNCGGTTWIYDGLIVSNSAYVAEWQAIGEGDGVCNSVNDNFSHLFMENCTVADNVSATNSCGVYNGKSLTYAIEANLLNCIVVGHTDDVYNGNDDKKIQVSASCIGTEDVFWTDGVDGCILWSPVDPLFNEQSSGDYRLVEDAVAKDAGINRYWMDDTPDLDGNRRIVHGTVDMGCYEFHEEKGTLIMFR
ncbi:MAG: DUF1565 domain-containing protein [Kiritimatiellia bacterium]|jgi:hypothetical protein